MMWFRADTKSTEIIFLKFIWDITLKAQKKHFPPPPPVLQNDKTSGGGGGGIFVSQIQESDSLPTWLFVCWNSVDWMVAVWNMS